MITAVTILLPGFFEMSNTLRITRIDMGPSSIGSNSDNVHDPLLGVCLALLVPFGLDWMDNSY